MYIVLPKKEGKIILTYYLKCAKSVVGETKTIAACNDVAKTRDFRCLCVIVLWIKVSMGYD